MDSISAPATFSVLLMRLMLATALGAAVGLNRERHGKPAGLRTHALVALGAALVVEIALALTARDGFADSSAVSRVIQGLIAGIGFVGGGVILHLDAGKGGVHGLTTAAAIWVVAAIGVAAGTGMWRSAVAAAALTLLVLVGGEFIDRALHRIPPNEE